VWSFPVTIHFAHRAMALVITVVLVGLVARIWRNGDTFLRGTSIVLTMLLMLQITLGAYAVWSLRDPYITTAHVIIGAVLFAVTFGLTCWTYHPAPAGGTHAAPEPDGVTVVREGAGS